MKFAIPEISWHNRDPVLSADFQPKTGENGLLRLATGGTDSHVLIWYISTTDTGAVNLEVAADLTRHQKAVNVVRWSPNGELLASGDDESIIFIWKQKLEKEPVQNMELEEQYKETWVIHKTLRGHMEDVLDLSWSADSLHLASGSVDNKLLMWDVARGRYSCILSDHKGFVQGVCWDPKGQMIATASTDRTFRTFDVTTKKVLSRSSKAVLPFPPTHPLHNTKVRLYHDDTLQTFYRRVQFSPDGLLVAVPAGRIEPEQGKMEGKPINAVYIYTRYSLKVPVCVLPCGEPALVCRWGPRLLAPRAAGPAPAFPGGRAVLAVGTRRSVLLYDTQQKTPIALISNIHYTRLTDLTWAPDGLTLVASSTDGFCSVITFSRGELGEALPAAAPPADTAAPEPMEYQTEDQPTETQKPDSTPVAVNKLVPKPTPTNKSESKSSTPINKLIPKSAPSNKPEAKSTTPTLDSFIKFKAPSEKSPKKQKSEPQQKTPIKMDAFEDMAMPSWSDNSSNEIIRPKETEMELDKPEIMIIEDSEDMKLVYDESQGPKSVDQLSKDSKLADQSPKSAKSSDQSSKSAKSSDQSPKSAKSSDQSPKSAKSSNQSPKSDKSSDQSSKSAKSNDQSPKRESPKSSENAFLKTAKVTDVKEAVQVKAVPSPKTPRRVNLITLSSPKNKKKL